MVWIVFHAAGGPGTSSTLHWTKHDLNEGLIPSTATDGVVNVVSASTISMPDDANGESGTTAVVPVSSSNATG